MTRRLAAHSSVVCSDGRHHACRPNEWSCNCPCHLGNAVLENADAALSSSDDATEPPPGEHGTSDGESGVAASTERSDDGNAPVVPLSAHDDEIQASVDRHPTSHPKARRRAS